ncbi:MAG: hypothetical protein AB7N80_13055 [Bdellovibrionales bacterium]
MSTINGSDNSSARQDEIIRRNREEARQNESEIIKKHQKEITRLTEQHSQEVERLQQNHQKQMSELKRQSQDGISRRDHKYQQEIEGLRGLHRKQMQDTANNASRNVDLNRKTASTEVQQAQIRNDERVQDLNESYRRSLDELSASHARTLGEMRERQQEAVQNYRENLNKKHQGELEALGKNRQKEVQESERQHRSYRTSTEARLRNQELAHMQDQQKASDNLLATVRSERQNQTQNEAMLREGFKEGLNQTRERFEKKMEQERDAAETAGRGTRKDVYERINGQMRRLEQANRELKEVNVRDQLQRKREAERQVDNVKEAYQNNVEIAMRERNETIRDSNDNTAKQINQQQKKNEHLMVNLNRNYLHQLDTQEMRHRGDIDMIESDFKARSDQTKHTTDQRVRHIVDQTESEKLRLSELHDANRQVLAKNQRDEANELRAFHQRDKLEAVERIKDAMRKQEIQHQEKMTTLSSKYEKEIARLNDEMARTKRSHDEDMKRITAQFQRQHQTELDAQQIQFQEKLRKTQTQHSEEMRTTNQRNQERFDQLLTTVKKA